jgi:hypothetical protein
MCGDEIGGWCVLYRLIQVGAFATPFLLGGIFWFGLWPQVKAKQADVALKYLTAYDELALEAHSGERQKWPHKARSFFRRFWTLQHSEFGMFRFGLLAADTYAFWVLCRVREIQADTKVYGWTYKEGWRNTAERFSQTDFQKFMKVLMIGLSLIEARSKRYECEDSCRRQRRRDQDLDHAIRNLLREIGPKRPWSLRRNMTHLDEIFLLHRSLPHGYGSSVDKLDRERVGASLDGLDVT